MFVHVGKDSRYPSGWCECKTASALQLAHGSSEQDLAMKVCVHLKLLQEIETVVSTSFDPDIILHNTFVLFLSFILS